MAATPRPTPSRRSRSRRTSQIKALSALLLLAAGLVVAFGLATDKAWAPTGLVVVLVLAVLARVEISARRSERRATLMLRREAAAQESIRELRATIASQAQQMNGVTRAVDRLVTGNDVREALRTGGPLDVRLRHDFEQVQATINLFDRVQTRGLVPAMRGWAASPDVLNVLVDELLTHEPRVVVECGSGVSTLWLALAIRQYNIRCRVVSLDHDPQFLEATAETLRRHGVADVVDLRLAPLAPCGLAGHDTTWYDMTVLDDVSDVGLVFVDGPPGSTGPSARYPAVPALLDKMARHAVVILDDTARQDEADTVSRWTSEFPDFRAEVLNMEKGATVLRRGSPT